MIKEKTGRVTFMPLNRLKPKNPPAPNAQDAEPLIDKLRFDRTYEKAFQQVFGKTCVCRDLTIAAAYVKSHGINTITLDGDKVDRKGALTGGYHDVRRSRIEAIKNVATWRAKFAADDKRSKEVKVAIVRLEQEVTQVTGKLTVLTGQQNQLRESRERSGEEGNMLTRQKEKVKQRITALEGDVYELETELAGLEAKLAGYTAELSSPLTQSLTGQEEEMIGSLGKEVERRQKEMLELNRRKNKVVFSFCFCHIVNAKIFRKLESQKNALEIELNEHLRRRREEIRAKHESLDESEDNSTSPDALESRTRELRSLEKSIVNLTKKNEGKPMTFY